MLKKAVLFVRRSSLVSRRSQALIFLLSRYASRFTNDGLLEIRFTRNASRDTVFALADFFSILMVVRGEA